LQINKNYFRAQNLLFVLPKIALLLPLCNVTNKEFPMPRISPFLSFHRPVGKFVQVEFGNPKKRDCAGFGICNVEDASHPQLVRRACCEECKTMAHLSYIRLNKRLVLQFRHADLSSKAYARHFAGGAFLIEEDFFVPPAIVRACGLPLGAVFPRGRHFFREEGGHLKISFSNIPMASRTFPIASLPQIGLTI
jgi:hypothetical protein